MPFDSVPKCYQLQQPAGFIEDGLMMIVTDAQSAKLPFTTGMTLSENDWAFPPRVAACGVDLIPI
jgi:hypothetical protein